MQMERIILFDGICNFCASSVQFIIRNDPKGKFQFASLQSDIGRKLLNMHHVPENIDSMILIEDGQVYYESTAALRIARQLKGLLKLLYICIIIPAPIRNIAYHFLAKNRYKWFGKKESCMLPSPEIKKRFLE